MDYQIILKGEGIYEDMEEKRYHWLAHIVAHQMSLVAMGRITFPEAVKRSTAECKNMVEVYMVVSSITVAQIATPDITKNMPKF